MVDLSIIFSYRPQLHLYRLSFSTTKELLKHAPERVPHLVHTFFSITEYNMLSTRKSGFEGQHVFVRRVIRLPISVHTKRNNARGVPAGTQVVHSRYLLQEVTSIDQVCVFDSSVELDVHNASTDDSSREECRCYIDREQRFSSFSSFGLDQLLASRDARIYSRRLSVREPCEPYTSDVTLRRQHANSCHIGAGEDRYGIPP